MGKVDFSKVEKSFDLALEKLLIENLSELATITDLAQDSQNKISSKTIEEIIERFQKQLAKIKKSDPVLFAKLLLTEEEETRFARPVSEYAQEDWLELKKLKLRIEELKKELYGQEEIDAAHDEIVTKERKRHINKRFNIRDGWLPLH